MISRFQVFNLLGQALWADQNHHGDEYGSFAFSMRVGPSGWSSDPALLAIFEEKAPREFGSASAALEFSADYIQSQLVEHWRYPDGASIVAALRQLAANGDCKGAPIAYKELATKLRNM